VFDKLTGDVQGPIEVKGGLEIDGTLHGGAVVTGTLDLHGTILGPLEVRLDGHADVEGIVRGDVHARGGKLRLRGVVEGRLGVKEGADVLFAVGSVLNGRRLEADGSFTTVEKAGKYSIPDDAPMMRPQADGAWVLAS
jgi:cytoskeletal protein CcmA (bactofilin family)